ncbi:hypothetical protein H4219_001107 [Mycoemilia scoparia]|uniref:SCP domain-containing protein n=1 Tax=Mycoemilia scoparia TaxID=417184 RepID=A0A9W8DWG0_9FUNG|nr:hypothetical protein H4219_001107 [Mycoemilia scoparia]
MKCLSIISCLVLLVSVLVNAVPAIYRQVYASQPKQAAPIQVSASAQISLGMSNLQTEQMLCLLNQRRAREGLPPLAIHPELMKSAQAHSDYQASIRTMTHSDPSGDIIQRIRSHGLQPQAAAENVAYLQKTVPEVVNAWFNSTEHLENILSTKVYVGFGLRNNAWTQHFATPMGYNGNNNAKPPPNQCPGLSLELSTNIRAFGLLAVGLKAQIGLSLGDGAIGHVVNGVLGGIAG